MLRKRPERAAGPARPRPTRAPLRSEIVGGQGRVAVGPLQELGRRPIALVHERAAQPASGPSTSTDSCTARSTKRPRPRWNSRSLPVGVEAAVTDPPTPEDVAPRDARSRRRHRSRPERLDLPAQLGTDLLVGVDREDPFAPGLVHGEVLLGGEARPGPHEDPVGESARDLDRLVVRLGVDHDDLVGPGQAGQARAQALLFVPGDDHRRAVWRESGHRRSSSSSSHAASTGSAVSEAMVPVGGVQRPMPGAVGSVAGRIGRSVEADTGRSPSAAAMCSGPVSAATITLIRRSSGEEPVKVVGGASSAPGSRRRWRARVVELRAGPTSRARRRPRRRAQPPRQLAEARERPALVGATRARGSARPGGLRGLRPGADEERRRCAVSAAGASLAARTWRVPVRHPERAEQGEVADPRRARADGGGSTRRFVKSAFSGSRQRASREPDAERRRRWPR